MANSNSTRSVNNACIQFEYTLRMGARLALLYVSSMRTELAVAQMQSKGAHSHVLVNGSYAMLTFDDGPHEVLGCLV